MRNNHLLTGFIFTLIWILFSVYLIYQSQNCIDQNSPLVNSIQKLRFFYFEINCLTVNEIGDSLAGIFAPLAFIWLVVAVLLQNKGLTEQIAEMTQVSNASRKNIEHQTKLLAKADELELLARITELCRSTAKIIKNNPRIITIAPALNSERQANRDLSQFQLLKELQNIDGMTTSELIREVGIKALLLVDNINEWDLKYRMVSYPLVQHLFNNLMNIKKLLMTEGKTYSRLKYARDTEIIVFSLKLLEFITNSENGGDLKEQYWHAFSENNKIFLDEAYGTEPSE